MNLYVTFKLSLKIINFFSFEETYTFMEDYVKLEKFNFECSKFSNKQTNKQLP